MNLEDIDQIQSNGSTALHAACYFNHLEIVRRLLEAGASRAIKNKYGCIPYEETTNPQIRALFQRIPGNNRFIGASGKIEWIIVTPYVKETARAERHSLMFYANHSLEELVQRATKFYLSTQLSSVDKIDQVKYFFQQAIEKGDAEYIVKAYTAETGFYSRLNRDLAGGAETGKHERQFIVGIITCHPAFDKYTYIGKAYRGLRMTQEDLDEYSVGSCLMTKSFLSTTKDHRIAESFARNTQVRINREGDVLKFPTFCTYIIKNKRTALAIENISEYEDEKEVLIMPYAVFTIKAVDRTFHPIDHDAKSIVQNPAPTRRNAEPTDLNVQPAGGLAEPAGLKVQPAGRLAEPVDHLSEPTVRLAKPAGRNIGLASRNIQPAATRSTAVAGSVSRPDERNNDLNVNNQRGTMYVAITLEECEP
ncbi:unnamed protein product [Rotaria sp. Silwood1]|nr:unnamed protein product [Rotaria sp. Silwood1]